MNKVYCVIRGKVYNQDSLLSVHNTEDQGLIFLERNRTALPHHEYNLVCIETR